VASRGERPYLTTAIVLWVIGLLLLLPALGALTAGTAGARGFAPVGISIGVLVAIAGTLLFFTGPKKRDEDDPNRPVDDE
jgi:amino acid transporter